MSQQNMEFEEPIGQQQAPPFDNYQTGYRDPFAASYGQKIPTSPSSGVASAGQRLTLAMVSLVILLPLSSILFGTILGTVGGFMGLMGALIGLGVICVTIIAVNFTFNYRR